MRDVIALVEGETELEFIQQVVAPHLQSRDVSLRAVLPGNPKRTQHGGVHGWDGTVRDLLRYLNQGKTLTTLFDFYALKLDWPGRSQAALKSWNERGPFVEKALAQAVVQMMDSSYNPARFIPCIQVHEFESLLFVHPATTALSLATSCKDDANIAWADSIERQLTQVLKDHGGQADAVNDSAETAPSKRLKKIVPGYDKRAWGYQVARDVTLHDLRSGSRWLDSWLSRLEALG